MVLFNYAIREVTAKLVYYGPGLCGKTTNLQFIHEKLDPGARGKLLSLATDGDRTLFFDFLPIEMGTIGGYKVRFQLYTVPGQVHYNATRKLVLKGVDAVAFVADSQVSMLERNRESFANLIENLIENGYDPAKIPIVVQLNKRDLPEVASVSDLVSVMGVEGYPAIEAVASRGDGVFETLKTIVKLTLSRLRTQFDTGAGAGAETPEAPPPPPPPPPPSPAAVFAPPPPAVPPPPEPPVFVPPVFVPPPPPPEIEIPPLPSEALDEFDLEDFEGDAAEPVAAPGAQAAFGEAGLPEEEGLVDLEADMETIMDGQLTSEEVIPGFQRESGTGDQAAAELVEPEAGLDDGWYVEAPAPEADAGIEAAGEPPPWARGMMEELRSLRAENRSLREALRGIGALLERQVGVLQDGRAQLERLVGESGESGESTP